MLDFIKSKKLYICFFFAVLVISAFFPPSADDLGWATSQGAALLKKGFENYNGRYLGNILAVSLTRIGLLLAPLKAFVLTAILFYTQKLSAAKSDFSLLLCAVLLLIPSPLFVQGFVWTAGFTNYTVSALLIMVSADLIINRKSCAINAFFLMILGIACQLFMETYTIFTLVAGATAIIYSAVKKKGTAKSVCFFIGAVAGTAIMFSNGIYSKIANGDNVYQQIPVNEGGIFNKLFKALASLFSVVSYNAVIACIPAILVVTVLSVMLIKKSAKLKKAFWAAFSLMIVSVLAFPAVYLITRRLETAYYTLGAFLLFFFATAAVAVAGITEAKTKTKTAVLFAMLLVLCVPLSIVYPVGPRCFVGAYILILIAICELLKEFEFAGNKKTVKFISAAFALVFIFDLICYSTVFFSNKNKIESIRSQAEQSKQVVIERTKLSFFVYAIDSETSSAKYMQRFCEYYDLPEDIQITYK